MNIKFFAKISILLVVSLQLFAQERKTFSLEELKKFAVEHNQQIQSLRHQVEGAGFKKNKLRSSFFPKLGLAGGAESTSSTTQNESNSLAYVYGTYNLFNGLKDRHSVNISDLELEKAQAKLQAAEFRIGLEVEQYFYLYVFKKTLMQLKGQSIERNAQNLSFVKKARAFGSGAETDTMEYQLRDANLKSELVANEQELEEARSSLKQLLGENIGSNLEPVGGFQHQHLKTELSALVSKLNETAETIKIASLDLEIAKIDQKIATGGWLPQLNFDVKSGYIPQPSTRGPDREIETNMSLVATWEIFSGGETRADRREKASKVMEVEALLRDDINTAIRKVEISFRALKGLEIRSDLEKNNLEFAQKYYRSVVSEYKQGIKNSADVAAADDKLTTAEIRKIELEYQFLKERLELEKTTGRSVEVEVIK